MHIPQDFVEGFVTKCAQESLSNEDTRNVFGYFIKIANSVKVEKKRNSYVPPKTHDTKGDWWGINSPSADFGKSTRYNIG